MGPLQGIRLLEIAGIGPGPYCAIDAGPVRLVLIDTGILGGIDRDQAEWLREVSAGDKPKILLTGKHIRAPEAKAIGLVGHVVPDGQALAKAREIAEVICANGPLAVEAITRTLHECDGMELDQALRYEWGYGQAVFASEDAKEGPLAFAQKRKPQFKGE